MPNPTKTADQQRQLARAANVLCDAADKVQPTVTTDDVVRQITFARLYTAVAHSVHPTLSTATIHSITAQALAELRRKLPGPVDSSRTDREALTNWLDNCMPSEVADMLRKAGCSLWIGADFDFLAPGCDGVPGPHLDGDVWPRQGSPR